MKLQELFESLDSKFKFNTLEETPRRYVVTVSVSDKKLLKIKADYFVRDDEWTINFSEIIKDCRTNYSYEQYSKTYTGEELKVFSAVKQFLGIFINKYHPINLYFDADKTEGESRSKLYIKLVTKYANSLGYKSNINNELNHITKFKLTKI